MTRVLVLGTLLVLAASCEEDRDEYLREHRGELLKVRATTMTIEADGKSTALITAVLPGGADNRTVQFTTSEGSFLEAKAATYSTTATPSVDSLLATTTLQSTLEPSEGVRVKVSASGIDTTLVLRFAVALPDSLQVESTVASIPKGFGSEVPLQAILIRNTGTPSLHQRVDFSALRDNGQPIGEFRGIDPARSNEKGIVSSVFVLKDTLYTGPVRLVANATGKTKPLSDTTTIFVTK